MKSIVLVLISAWISLFFTACGSSAPTSVVKTLQKGYLVDSPIAGMQYHCADIIGVTNSQGLFECREFPVTFHIGELIIGTVSSMPSDKKVYPQDILGKARTNFTDAKVVSLTRFLQSLDDDGDIEKVIQITSNAKEEFIKEQELSSLAESEVKALVEDAGKTYVTKEAAMEHLKDNVEKLTSIMITPTTTTIELGKSASFKAEGSFSNGLKKDITSEVTWSSSKPAIATLTGAIAQAKSVGTTNITATYKGKNKTVTLTVTTASLVSLDINATDTNLAEGTETTLSVKGLFADDTEVIMTSQVTWSSSDTSKASVDTTGTVKALSAGEVTITATKGDVSDTETIMISAATLTGIELTPATQNIAKGLTTQLTVTGTYTNGQTQTLASGVDFNSSNVTVATVDASGKVTAIKEGTVTINAKSGTFTSQSTVTVTPAVLSSIMINPLDVANIANGKTAQLSVTGTYSDNTTKDLTSQITWSSNNTAVASIASDGKVLALSTGSTQLTATMGTVTENVNITVTPAILTSLSVATQSASVAKGLTTQLSATGTYSDGSTKDVTSQIAWSTNNSFVSINSAGLLTASNVGSVNVTATLSGKTAQTTIEATAAKLVSISIAAIADIEKGKTGQLTARGTYTDNTTKDISSKVTWSSSDASKATINNTGLITTLQEGTVSMTASLDGVSMQRSVTVLPPVLMSLTLAPTTAINLIINKTAQLTVTGAYSDGTSKDISSALTWTSSSDIVAIDSDGLVHGYGIGTTTVTGTLGGKSVTKQVTISGIPFTEVSGQIRVDTTWTLDKSPYKLTDTIQVAEGSTLTIEPGVRVYGDDNTIEVFGTLNVLGNESLMINLRKTRVKSAKDTKDSIINFDYVNIFYGEISQNIGSSGLINITNSFLKNVRHGDFLIYNTYHSCHIENNIFVNMPTTRINGSVQ